MDNTTLTDDLIAEIEVAAKACSDLALDTAESIISAENGAHIECPVCHGEGYADLENDYCNFDNHAIGVQFYGIGPEFGAGENYFRAAKPANILALITELRSLRADADIGRKVISAMDQLQADERYASMWSTCALLLISLADEIGSTCSSVTEEGVTNDGIDIGDWRVTVERIDAAMQASKKEGGE